MNYDPLSCSNSGQSAAFCSDFSLLGALRIAQWSFFSCGDWPGGPKIIGATNLPEWYPPSKFALPVVTRRGVRVAEGARLESVFTRNRNVGSNPTLSAMYHTVRSSARCSPVRGFARGSQARGRARFAVLESGQGGIGVRVRSAHPAQLMGPALRSQF